MKREFYPANNKKIMMKMTYILSVVVVLALFACKTKKNETAPASEVFYTCSMHPQIMEPNPGKCPICHMDLIPVEKKKSDDPDAIVLNDQQIQLGNIQVDTIGKGVIENETVLTATLNIDETKTTTISARISGRIERLYFKSEGDYIQKGAKLYDLYSEELNNAKQEYILALEKQRVLDNSIIDLHQLVQSAKNKLILWGMSEEQIRELEKTKQSSVLTSFYSPANGFVSALISHEGDYIMEGGVIVRLANLSSLWAEAQVYTSELSKFDAKSLANVRLPDLNMEVKGNIQLVNPEINPDTRINLVRVAIANPGNQLKPGMPAYVIIRSKQKNSLTLPVDAVIRDESGATVWVQTGKNIFKNKMVTVGMESNGVIEISSGLKVGDIVVTSGAYLLNSEYIFEKGANPMEGMKM